jgi:hypothetical protein
LGARKASTRKFGASSLSNAGDLDSVAKSDCNVHRLMPSGHILRLAFATLLTLTLLILIAWHHQVDNTVTAEDRIYIEKYLDGISPGTTSTDFQQTLDYVAEVQRRVILTTPDGAGIPYNQSREPRYVYLAKTAMCFDRSRAIEKILRYSGFQVRHVAMHLPASAALPLPAVSHPGSRSHAVSEVMTARGWMLVDSNTPWLAIDRDGKVYSARDIQHAIEHGENISWASATDSPFFTQKASVVYGLYSRHGKFYPPYNFIPDINYHEFMHNFGFLVAREPLIYSRGSRWHRIWQLNGSDMAGAYLPNPAGHIRRYEAKPLICQTRAEDGPRVCQTRCQPFGRSLGGRSLSLRCSPRDRPPPPPPPPQDSA